MLYTHVIYICYIHVYVTCLEFEEEKKVPTTKGSMNARMEPVWFSASNAVKNHCTRHSKSNEYFP